MSEPASSRPGLFSAPRQDILASLVVFLVAVPLSLGIALASGAPIMAGLVAGIVGGMVAGLVAGAPLQVTGPAAGLTAIVFGLVEQLGDWRLVCAAVVVGGLIQLVLGAARIARMCLAVSPAVVHGMLAGIGITIALAQLHIILGGAPESHALKNLAALPAQLADLHAPAAFLGLATIALLLAWQWAPRPLSAVPASLVAVVVATVASVALGLEVERIDLGGGFSGGLRLAAWPAADMWVPVLMGGVTIALVASVESLLCAVATDKLHTGTRANLDRELVGQGLANTLSGFLGGLPVTGVIVRSSANVQAGAQTQLSAVLHSVWILFFVLFLAGGIELIPLSVLAGLLVYVGIRLVDAHHIRRLMTFREALVYGITVAGVVGLGLLPGVGLGLALAVMLLLGRLSRTQIAIEGSDGVHHVRIGGSLTFVGVPSLTAALQRIPRGSRVDVDLMVDFMDHAGFEALHDWRVMHERLGGSVDIDELHEAWYANAASGNPRFGKSRIDGLLAAVRRRGRKPGLTGRRDGAEGGAHALVEGAAAFNETTSHEVKPLLSHLADVGQTPQALFITCADSRIVPADLVNADPGDLFVVRNIGNLVPHHMTATSPDHSVGAAIEFAVDVLGVHSIVICGHSECGAMKALLGSSSDRQGLGASLQEWLTHGESSVARHHTEVVDSQATTPHNHLARCNVVEQMERLRSYPSVERALTAGTLQLHGWYFDLKRAKVTAWDPKLRRFRDLAIAPDQPSLPAVS